MQLLNSGFGRLIVEDYRSHIDRSNICHLALGLVNGCFHPSVILLLAKQAPIFVGYDTKCDPEPF